MCFTDPPYGVNYASTPKDKQRGKYRPILNDHPGEEFEMMLRAANANILSVTKGAIYVCMSSSELDTLQRAFRAAVTGLERRALCQPATRRVIAISDRVRRDLADYFSTKAETAGPQA